MKAIVHTQYGPPNVLQFTDVAKPTPADDEVLIKLSAASVNPLDLFSMRGAPLIRLIPGLRTPKHQVLGCDIAGRVEAVGKQVKQFQPGDEVFGVKGFAGGGFAEYACTPEDKLALKPANISFEEAAAIPVAAITALQGLRDKGRIQRGHKVLVDGASGGVGTFAVQIAKSFGAEVTAVCSTRNVNTARSIGADHVIDYTREDFTQSGQRYDLIIGANAHHSIFDYRRALSQDGIYVLVGGGLVRILQGMCLGPLLSLIGSKKMCFFIANINQKDLVFLKDLLEAGKVVPVIDRRYPLSDAAEALRYLEEGHAQGKVVLKLLDDIAEVRVADSLTPTRTIDGATSVKVCPQCNGWFEGEIDHCPSDGAELVGAAAARTPPALPTAIGRYRILRLLGAGGMGAVYQAEQEQPRRTVALKVIKPGLAGPELLRRFEQESQALGRLQHPGIAQIYEAGTADTGFGRQPYFAMEFIRGESLLQYAEAHQLNTRQRLELMAKVCEAVHHAHQRGIIHRDLKPGNILVDESSQPKVLDFGVARVTDSDAQATRQTDVGRLVGTLAYMSPEQVLADPLEVDTRSDVYALGVILYELLAGRSPYKVTHNIPEAVQTIREEDPAPLSSVSRNYRGDIETIVAKALEKDKARRYASAAGLAGDIRRYLTDEPIVARPPSATYQLQKFARRHKALVGGIAAVFVVLIAGIIASTREATRARHAEQAATTQAATAKAVNDFLQNDLLAQASANVQARPDTKPDPDLKVRTALDRAAAKIEGKFKDQPLVEASIRQTIGATYADLGLYPQAQRQIERALDLQRGLLGEVDPKTLETMNLLVDLFLHQGKFTLAEPLAANVVEMRRRVLGAEHPSTLTSMNNLALLYRYQGKYAQAEPLYVKVLELQRRVLGEEHLETLTSMNNLATLYLLQGKYPQAESLYTTVLELERRVLGEEHPNTLAGMHNLAELYRREGKYTQAQALFTKVVEVRRRVLGEEHLETLTSMGNLAVLYAYQGKYTQAQPLLTKVLEVRRRVLGQEHPETLDAMNDLAVLYQKQGEYSQAEPLLTKAFELKRHVLGEEHPATLATMNALAQLYLDQGKREQSESLFNKVLGVRRRVLGPQHPDTINVLVLLGEIRLQQQRYGDAEPLLREALTSYEKTTPDHYRRYNSECILGASLAGQKRYTEAESLLLSGYRGMLQQEVSIPAFDRIKLEQAVKSIIQLYQDWGKPDQAAEWRGKLHLISSAAHTK